MRLLSIESSAKSASVALTEDGRLLSQFFQNTALTHSRTLLPMADDLLKNMEMSVEDIDEFAVARGPGSFTGIRIGIAAVKGMAFALDKPCIGVSTLEAMAWQAQHMEGIICACMDARREQVYNALFRMEDGKLLRLTEDRAIGLAELFNEIKKMQLLLVGDGAELCYNYFYQKGISAQMLPENIRFQSAWGVAMAAREVLPCSAHDLKPNYIRLSQAERELLKKRN